MSTSQVATCEDALYALLQANATLAAIDGPPLRFEPPTPAREQVFLYENTAADQDFDTTGNMGGAKVEVMTLRVGVFVQKLESQTETSEAAFIRTRDRADVLSAIVETIVRTNAVRTAPSVPPWDLCEVKRIERFSSAYDNVRGIMKILYVEATVNGL